MNENDFLYWLKGYLHDSLTLDCSQIMTIENYLECTLKQIKERQERILVSATPLKLDQRQEVFEEIKL